MTVVVVETTRDDPGPFTPPTPVILLYDVDVDWAGPSLFIAEPNIEVAKPPKVGAYMAADEGPVMNGGNVPPLVASLKPPISPNVLWNKSNGSEKCPNGVPNPNGSKPLERKGSMYLVVG
jgi:hypothetical protein